MKKPGNHIKYLVYSLTYLLIKNAYGLINGNEADVENFKYIVIVDPESGPGCGGGIISDYYVLTAAHCVSYLDEKKHELHFYKKIEVIAATSSYISPSKNQVTRDVIKIYVPKTHVTNSTADIALLKLKTSLELKTINKNVLQALQLPTPIRRGRYDTYADCQITFAGYGRPQVDAKMSFGRLRSAPAVIIENTKCQESYNLKILNSHMCLKIRQDPREKVAQGTCTGDSGSPVVVDNVIVAVNSHSDKTCNTNNFPTILTRVQQFIPMINNIMIGKPRNVWVYP